MRTSKTKMCGFARIVRVERPTKIYIYKMWLIDERERCCLFGFAAKAARGHATLSGCRTVVVVVATIIVDDSRENDI
jgi:hypothetical protein